MVDKTDGTSPDPDGGGRTVVIHPPPNPREPPRAASRDQESDDPQIEQARIAFLATEQTAFLSAIVHLEESKRKSYHFLFLLTGAFLAFCGAIYRIKGAISSELLAFYGICGSAIAVVLIFHTMRLLRDLGRAIRRRAFIYKAITTTRAWVMRQRPTFFKQTVFPEGDLYGSGRTGGSEREKYPNQYSYNQSTTSFLAFVQTIFVLGLVYFVSLIIISLKSSLSGQGIVLDLANEAADYLRRDQLLRAFQVCCLPMMLWLQFLCNECAHYQMAIWEAKRIEPERPNPIFPRGIFRREYPIIVVPIVLGSMWVAFLLALLVSITGLKTGTWGYLGTFEGLLRNPVFAFFLLFGFLVGKIAYAGIEISLARDKKRKARSGSDQSLETLPQ